MAGVATLVMFGTAATIALVGSPSHPARPPLYRPAIVERLAPAPREQIVAQAPPTPVTPPAVEHEQQTDVAQPTKNEEPLTKKASKHEARTPKATVLPEETRKHLAALVPDRGAANHPSATEPTTAPASAIPAALTISPPAPTSVRVAESGTAEVATAAPAQGAPAAATAKPALVANTSPSPPAPAVVLASATPAPATTSREASVGSWCFFTKGDGSHFVINCAEVSDVRAPLDNEFGPEIQAVMSVGRGIKTVRESVDEVRQMVLAHGGHL